MEALFAKAAQDTKGQSQAEKQSYLMLILSRQNESMQEELVAATGLKEEVFVGCLHKFGNGGEDTRCMEILMAMQAKLEEFRGNYLSA